MENLKILKEHRDFYLRELNKVLSFWYDYGYDKVNGGFYTYLDKNGKVYCEDKSVWAQGRAVYIFAKAYQLIEKREEWLKVARDTFAFVQDNAFNTRIRCILGLLKPENPYKIEDIGFQKPFILWLR